MGSSASPVRGSAYVAMDDYARALLHALARDEATGRRSPRLTEAGQATWQRFRGRAAAPIIVAASAADLASDKHPLRQQRSDFIVGLRPDKGGKLAVADQLALWRRSPTTSRRCRPCRRRRSGWTGRYGRAA